MVYLTDVLEKLNSLNIPLAYGYFEDSHAFPYMVYGVVSKDPLSYSDNKVETYSVEYQLDLYTEQKDFELQDMIEKEFESLGLSFSESESVVKSEHCYVCVFYFTLTERI